MQTDLFRKVRPLIDMQQLKKSTTALFDSRSSDEQDVAPFPLLTQGDHPILGTPCWYLHPCETSAAICEILEAKLGSGWDDTSDDVLLRCLVQWLEAWFLIVGGVMDLNDGVV